MCVIVTMKSAICGQTRLFCKRPERSPPLPVSACQDLHEGMSLCGEENPGQQPSGPAAPEAEELIVPEPLADDVKQPA